MFIPVTTQAADNEATAGELLSMLDQADTNGKKVIELLVERTAQGMSWANAYVTPARHAPKFCAPQEQPALNLTGTLSIDIVRDRVKHHPSDKNEPFGTILLDGLRERFPWPQTK